MEMKKYSILRIKKHPSKLNVPLAWALGSGLWACTMGLGAAGEGMERPGAVGCLAGPGNQRPATL